MKPIAALILVLGMTVRVFAQESLVPYPQSLTAGQGHFDITVHTTLAADTVFGGEAAALNSLLQKGLGQKLRATQHADIRLEYDATLTRPEEYTLDITDKGVVIRAGEPAGAFHAVETIRQLLPVSIETGGAARGLESSGASRAALRLPALHIEDYPAYAWRGMHLDVSRHFFSTQYLRRLIDRMALYKMNKLHLHLSDDQGWRIEIKKYPLLTERGAWRTFNNQDSACMREAKDNPDFAIDPAHIIHRDGKTLYGGFYTQTEMKALVAYAAARHVDIIPEIDMPGHMMAAINNYPFLTCNGENAWGTLFTKPICPCNESTFEFAENVFSEIMDIFPSIYIHIGGDEVDRSDWARSPACKALMEREGIPDLPALQSYFINRMEKFFNAHGRKLIGWDEIIEGNVSPGAAVMYWRTWVPTAPLKAAREGHQVVMAPGEPLYFDRPADQYDLYNVYHFNPSKDTTGPIIGAQACLWSEMVPTEARADFMAMPRLTALAENLWTHDVSKYDGYLERLKGQYARMEALHIHYRLPDLAGLLNDYVFVDAYALNIQAPLPNLAIRYTTDGTPPVASSPALPSPYMVREDRQLKIAAFAPGGNRGDTYTLNFTHQSMREPFPAGVLRTGLACSFYRGSFRSTERMAQARVDTTFVSDAIVVPGWVKAPAFGIDFSGYIDVPADGVYSFYLTCDDGGVLKIGPYTTVDNDGNHSARERSGQVALRAGTHPFDLRFIEAGGGYKLLLKYSVNGSEPVEVPAEWLKRPY